MAGHGTSGKKLDPALDPVARGAGRSRTTKAPDSQGLREIGETGFETRDRPAPSRNDPGLRRHLRVLLGDAADPRSHDPSETLPEPPRSLTRFAHGGVRRAGAPSAQARVPECLRCRASAARRRFRELAALATASARCRVPGEGARTSAG